MSNMSPVVHFEMPYENSERLVKFYTQAFDWRMQKLGKEMSDYVTAYTTETDENNMIKNREPSMAVSFLRSLTGPLSTLL